MAKTKKKRNISIKRLFRNRDVSVEVMTEDDLKYLWAAYNKGMWVDVIPDGLDKDSFREFIYNALSSSDGIYSIRAENAVDVIGLIHTKPEVWGGSVYHKAQLEFFPWATKRNKIEGAVKGVLDLRKLTNLIIEAVDDGSVNFMTHIAKYGILRRIGKLDQSDSKVYLFESMKVQ